MTTKVCSVCCQEKQLQDFYADKGSPGGFRRDCKKCKNEATYKWRDKNADYYNKTMRDYHATNPLKRDDCDLKRKYGVSREWFDKTLASQDNLCAVCGKPNSSKKRRLAVDHLPR